MFLLQACNLMVALLRERQFGFPRIRVTPDRATFPSRLDRTSCSQTAWFHFRIPPTGLKIADACALRLQAFPAWLEQTLDPVPAPPRPWAVDTINVLARIDPDRPGAPHLGRLIDLIA